jgi:hypothetical protein
MSKQRRSGSNRRHGRNGYEIGYGKPPKPSQFRPGQSGNPAGRRKGLRNLKTDVKSTLAIPIKVKEGSRTRTRSTQEAALMVLREKALRGDGRAIDRFIELADRFNNDAAQIGSQPLSSDDQAILAAYVAERLAATKTSTEPPNDRNSKPAKTARKKTRK